MPPRLSHTKSRRGCNRCKKRRVKCDEVHPTCGACRRHNVVCEYGLPSESGSLEQIASTVPERGSNGDSSLWGSSTNTPPNFIDSPYTDTKDGEEMPESTERRLTELFLLHHFIRIVPTLPPSFDPSLRDALINELPRIACQHNCLMNSMLALAALHLFYEEDKRALPYVPDVDWAHAHRTYLNLGIRQQRQALSELSSNNAEAICWASMFIVYLALKLLPRSSLAMETDAAQQYEPPMEWFSLSVPLISVFVTARKFMSRDTFISRLFRSKRPNLSNREELLTTTRPPDIDRLLDYATYPEYDGASQELIMVEEETKAAYEGTLSYVATVYTAVFSNAEEPLSVARRLLAFPVICPPHFCTLLQEKRPRALVIFALFASLMKYADHIWLFRGRAEAEVYGIEKVVGLPWQGLMQWIKQVMQQAEVHARDIAS